MRVLVAVNVAAVGHALLQAASPADAALRLIDVASWLEAAVLLGLAALCLARRWVAGRPRPLQWAVGLGVPALATLTMSLAAQRVGLGAWSMQAVWPSAMRALAAMGAAAALIEY